MSADLLNGALGTVVLPHSVHQSSPRQLCELGSWATCANQAQLPLSQGSGFTEAYFLIFGSQWSESWDPVSSLVGAHLRFLCNFLFSLPRGRQLISFFLRFQGLAPSASPSNHNAFSPWGLWRCGSFHLTCLSPFCPLPSPNTWTIPVVQWFSAGGDLVLLGTFGNIQRYWDYHNQHVGAGAINI